MGMIYVIPLDIPSEQQNHKVRHVNDFICSYLAKEHRLLLTDDGDVGVYIGPTPDYLYIKSNWYMTKQLDIVIKSVNTLSKLRPKSVLE